MIKILLIIQAFIALAVTGVILYAYIQAKREAEKVAAQQADLEAWLEYTADGTNETWQMVSAPSRPVGQDVPVFAGEYNKAENFLVTAKNRQRKTAVEPRKRSGLHLIL